MGKFKPVIFGQIHAAGDKRRSSHELSGLTLLGLLYRQHTNQQLNDALIEEVVRSALQAIGDRHLKFFAKLNKQAKVFGLDLQAGLKEHANIVVPDQLLTYLQYPSSER
jgi:hypothetical protein